MFVALRDLRFARGRFILIGSVVTLITILVGFLSGLTGGLAAQNVSGILALPGDRIVFSAPAAGSARGVDFSDSRITERTAGTWASTDGVTSVAPIGISQARAEREGRRVGIAAFGLHAGFDADSPTRNGEIGLSTAAAKDLDATVGDRVTVAGTTYTVGTVRGDWWYSHTPVVKFTLDDWRSLAAATGDQNAFATVLAVSGTPDWDSAASATDTVPKTPLTALTGIGSFASEIGSLLMIVAMLFGISALVVGAFFTVWTLQRAGDVAVLKALGASTGSLIRDALGQALVVLLIGTGLGLGIVSGLGALAQGTLPFLLSPLTTLVPAVLLIVLGLAGAAFALRSVTSADPLTALGSNR